MKTRSFDKFGGTMAIFGAIAGFLYAVSFVVLKDPLLYALFLTLLVCSRLLRSPPFIFVCAIPMPRMRCLPCYLA